MKPSQTVHIKAFSHEITFEILEIARHTGWSIPITFAIRLNPDGIFIILPDLTLEKRVPLILYMRPVTTRRTAIVCFIVKTNLP